MSRTNGWSMVEEGFPRATTLFELPLRLSLGLSPGRVALLSLGGPNGRTGHRPACSATLGETLMRGSSLSPLLLSSPFAHTSLSRGAAGTGGGLPLVGRSGDLYFVIIVYVGRWTHRRRCFGRGTTTPPNHRSRSVNRSEGSANVVEPRVRGSALGGGGKLALSL